MDKIYNQDLINLKTFYQMLTSFMDGPNGFEHLLPVVDSIGLANALILLYLGLETLTKIRASQLHHHIEQVLGLIELARI
jgi:hypothetical protein